jgi:hypothetical protein
VNASVTPEVVENNIRNMSFINNVNYATYIKFKFEEDFDDIPVVVSIFNTNETSETKYGDWKFPTKEQMNIFMNDKTTILLMKTKMFTVGKEALKQTYSEVKVEKEIQKALTTGKQILGFPIQFEDKKTHRFSLQRPTNNINEKGELMTQDKYETNYRNLDIFLHIDWTRVVITYTYKSYSDLISKLGGYKGFLGPVLEIFFPLSSLYFLVELGRIIIDKYKESYKSELMKTIKIYYEMLNKEPNLYATLDLNFKNEHFENLKENYQKIETLNSLPWAEQFAQLEAMLDTIFDLINLSENDKEKTLSDSYKIRALGISELDKTLEFNQECEVVGESTTDVNKPSLYTPKVTTETQAAKNKNAYQVAWTPKSALKPADPILDTIQS